MDDFVVIAESEEELIKKFNRRKDGVQSKGMKVNMNKTKVMISGESHKGVDNTGRWPCGVCIEFLPAPLPQCTKCPKWAHRKCSRIKGSMIKLSKSFVCRDCTDQQASVDRTSMDIGDGIYVRLPGSHDECRW